MILDYLCRQYRPDELILLYVKEASCLGRYHIEVTFVYVCHPDIFNLGIAEGGINWIRQK